MNLQWSKTGGGGETKPKTKSVQFKKTGTEVRLSCETKGAGIAFQYLDAIDKRHWQLYSKPIPIKKGLRATAIRIGYQQSDTLTIK